MSLKDVLHWRYAPKRMTGAAVPEEHIEAILKAAQYAPTSMGLQPFTMILIRNREMVERIRPIAYNQPQVSEASHLLVFASYSVLTEAHIDKYLQNICATRGVTMESLDAFRRSMLRFMENSSDEAIRVWAEHQTYLALGFAIAEAALLNVDVTPMEGFDPVQLDQLLGLQEKGLRSTALLAIGYRDAENDFLAHEKKVRRSLDELVIRICG
ncbi:nitroreductase family protein [Rurimicrobium arvi]|uniref:NAD(P)H-dependent oxidoreductase n=1 Tax=Rurimicrobium arvi TaxID=2049916 RepID=A0ABP8MXL6_9BACT